MARDYPGDGREAYRVVAMTTTGSGRSYERTYGPYTSLAAARGIATGLRATAGRYFDYGISRDTVATRIERSPLGAWTEVPA